MPRYRNIETRDPKDIPLKERPYCPFTPSLSPDGESSYKCSLCGTHVGSTQGAYNHVKKRHVGHRTRLLKDVGDVSVPAPPPTTPGPSVNPREVALKERPYCPLTPSLALNGKHSLQCSLCGVHVGSIQGAYNHVKRHHVGHRARVLKDVGDMSWRLQPEGVAERRIRMRDRQRKYRYQRYWQQKGLPQVSTRVVIDKPCSCICIMMR